MKFLLCLSSSSTCRPRSNTPINLSGLLRQEIFLRSRRHQLHSPPGPSVHSWSGSLISSRRSLVPVHYVLLLSYSLPATLPQTPQRNFVFHLPSVVFPGFKHLGQLHSKIRTCDFFSDSIGRKGGNKYLIRPPDASSREFNASAASRLMHRLHPVWMHHWAKQQTRCPINSPDSWGHTAYAVLWRAPCDQLLRSRHDHQSGGKKLPPVINEWFFLTWCSWSQFSFSLGKNNPTCLCVFSYRFTEWRRPVYRLSVWASLAALPAVSSGLLWLILRLSHF